MSFGCDQAIFCLKSGLRTVTTNTVDAYHYVAKAKLQRRSFHVLNLISIWFNPDGKVEQLTQT